MLTEGVQSSSAFVFRNAEWVTSRSIVATGALLILQAAILAPVIGWPSKGAALLVMFGAGGIVVLLQHRTVWLAGLLVAIIGFVWWSKRQPRDRPGTVFAATGVALILLPIAVWGFLQAGALVDSAEETVSRDSTATWRTTGWEQLIAANDSPSALAGGAPSGVDLTRVVGLGTKDRRIPTQRIRRRLHQIRSAGRRSDLLARPPPLVPARGSGLRHRYHCAGGWAAACNAARVRNGLHTGPGTGGRAGDPGVWAVGHRLGSGAGDNPRAGISGSARGRMNVTAILACHNRRDVTLRCLASYFGQAHQPGIQLDAVLVDDGSTDGTAEAVLRSFPNVEVVAGDGTLYWAGAMALAERIARRQDPDYLLWLNDDVVLDPKALKTLIDTAEAEARPCIAVGALRDPSTGELTYSGIRRKGRHPLRVEPVPPAEQPVAVETFNGNVVLVPRDVTSEIGPLDGAFVHGAADFDFGLRATKAGVLNLVAPGTIGTCSRNTNISPWLDPSLPRRERVRLLLGPKGLPPRARGRFLRRHGGAAWPVFWLASYVRAAPAILRPPRPGR